MKEQFTLKSRIISSLLWYLIFAAVIYFVNIKYLNYLALFLGVTMLSGSFIGKDNQKTVMLLKIILTVLLFIVYFFRP